MTVIRQAAGKKRDEEGGVAARRRMASQFYGLEWLFGDL
jgi:hypothetical protein